MCRGAWGGGGEEGVSDNMVSDNTRATYPEYRRTGGVKWNRHASFTSLQQGDNRSLVQIQSIVPGLQMGTQNFGLQMR